MFSLLRHWAQSSGLGVFLETERTSALSSCGCAISFPEAAILLVSDGADQKDRGPLGTRLVAVPPKVSLVRTKTIPPGELRR